MLRDNSCIWFALLVAIFLNCRSFESNTSTPLSTDTFFELGSSSPTF